LSLFGIAQKVTKKASPYDRLPNILILPFWHCPKKEQKALVALMLPTRLMIFLTLLGYGPKS